MKIAGTEYVIAPRGYLMRKQPKRPDSLSARQWKIQQKSHRKWVRNNKPWFGADEAAKIGDRRI